mmetsp:Transcript_108556/g.231853  ORF Transcript_108556/g.231853 Transcript_108556/m.231853 type:complete len:1240 (-) Transcript_108556:148-3867(-)
MDEGESPVDDFFAQGQQGGAPESEPKEDEEDKEDNEEEGELTGRLVQIHSFEGTLTPISVGATSGPLKDAPPEPVDPNGFLGCALGYEKKDATETYTILTFDGQLLSIAAAYLREYEPPEPEEGGFDLMWPGDPTSYEFFGQMIAEILNQKNYCLVQMFMTPQEREAAIDQTYDMGTKWVLPKKEFESAYMGLDNTSKYMMLPTDDDDKDPADAIARCDRAITDVGLLIEPFAPSLGFSAWGRMNGLVRLPLLSRNEEQTLRPKALMPQDYNEGAVHGHLDFLKRRTLLIMFLIDNGGGELNLYPKADENASPVKLPLSRNKMLIFRHDKMSYSYKPSGPNLALQTWLLSEPDTSDPNDAGVVSLPTEFHGNRAHIMSLTVRSPAEGWSPGTLFHLFSSGCDAQVRVPQSRWDIDLYYSEAGLDNYTYAQHGGFCEDNMITLFDNDLFGISTHEASLMSPGQRIIMETGFEVLYRGGFSKTACKNLPCGTFLGDSGNDWPYMMTAPDPSTALAGSNCITGSRLAHSLNLQGPCSVTDTACSSSLVATNLAHNAMRKHNSSQRAPVVNSSVDMGLVMGMGLLIGPSRYILYSGPHMLSPRGRCFTFDGGADGYARGEGCAGMLLKTSDSEEDIQFAWSCLVGSAANQDGRSASMTAPNGPSQQQCIRASMVETGITASQIAMAECHGTGTALGDPIEVSALRMVMQDRKNPILNTSAKTNIGHLEAAAGLYGLLKCTLSICVSCGNPSNHLVMLNPHMDVNGYPVYFESEANDFGKETSFSGVSSFGYGGTNARGDVWGRAQAGPRATREVTTLKAYERKGVFWQRLFHYGSPGPAENDQVCITGTWDAHSVPEVMHRESVGIYNAAVTLGDTRREQFHIILNRDKLQVIHPTEKNAPMTAGIEGPAKDGGGRKWLIDGKADGVPVGTIYLIQFKWSFSWERGETISIKWEPTENVTPVLERAAMYRHQYAIVGTWSSWKFQPMVRSREEQGLWTTSIRVGMSGTEEFQFIRDNDWTQSIHPALPKTRKTSVPVRGPDDQGDGKNWFIRGPQGEIVTIQLRILDGEITVTTASETKGVRTWQSVEDVYWPQYYITGTWNNWSFSSMTGEPEAQGVFKYRLRLNDTGMAEFQIVLEKNWAKQIYPHEPRAGLGEGIFCGPDNHGHDLNWLIVGEPSEVYEITMDLNQTDGTRMVLWERVAEADEEPALEAPPDVTLPIGHEPGMLPMSSNGAPPNEAEQLL